MTTENTGSTDTIKAINNGLSRVAYPILAGIWLTLFSIFFAACWGISIIGIPFAYAWLRICYFSFWPFGKRFEKIENGGKFAMIMNILWLIFNIIPILFLFVLFWAALAFTPGDGDKQLDKVFSFAFRPFGKRFCKD